MSTTVANFSRGAGQDKTLRAVTRDYQALAYAASLVLNPVEDDNVFNIGTLTGNLSLTINTANALIGQKVKVLFAADGGGSRTVTYSTGFAVSASTQVVVASKYGSIDLIFNGTSWQETTRALTA